MPVAVLLGPQRLKPTLRAAAAVLPSAERIGMMTGGWEEREFEDSELAGYFDGTTTNLGLNKRLDSILAADSSLLQKVYAWRDERMRLRSLYQVRLGHCLDAARALMAIDGDDHSLLAEQQAAIDVVKAIDVAHMDRMQVSRDQFIEAAGLESHEDVQQHRAALESIISSSDAIALAGGHLAQMLELVHMFNLGPMFAKVPLIAWSAGAMMLCPRVVLFHDSPPQGPGNAEVLEAGLGRVDGLLLLPHARHRLRLDDGVRVSLFARRFDPAICVPMNEGSRLIVEDQRVLDGEQCQRFERGGIVAALQIPLVVST